MLLNYLGDWESYQDMFVKICTYSFRLDAKIFEPIRKLLKMNVELIDSVMPLLDRAQNMHRCGIREVNTGGA